MIIRSPYEDVALAQVPLTAYVLDGAGERGARPAIIDGATGRVISYGELADEVGRTASGLVARGVAQGDVLALSSPNGPGFVIAYLAALAAGALVTTVNPLAPAADLTRQLAVSGARWLVTTAAQFTGGGDPESVGPLLPGIEARVTDCASGSDVGPGEPGEMLLRAPGAMRGYLDNPAATASTIDADGWLHTGDVVVADHEGWFRVIDRVKELIKYKGSQVAPAALEAVLLAHPAVADVAVIGRADERAGEIPAAFVVLRGSATASELMSYVAGRVAPHEKIRRLEFVTDIPRSPSGKILRRLLAEREQVPVVGRARLAGQAR